MYKDFLRKKSALALLVAGLTASSIFISPVVSRAADADAKPGGIHYQPNRFAKRATLHYELVWGVDSLNVKWAESGELIRFSWRVVDAQKAAAIADKKAEPQLIDSQAGVSLVIPQLEKVGKLRQS